MVAPLVVSLMVTVCVVVYVPATGLKVGVAAACVMVYAALPTALCAKPVATAIAWIVCVLLTVIGAVYFVDAVVGVPYAPPTGPKVGVAAACVMVYAALPTALCVKPVATAIAWIVCVLLTVIGAVYFVDDVVGVVPFVV